MKKLVVVVAIVLLLPVLAMGADISASHSADFGCGACHSAHVKVTAAAGSGAPLWGRTLTTETLLAYNGGDTAKDVVTPGAPAGDSKMCMSCHDGVSNAGTTGNQVGTTKADGKVDTNVTHPISFQYPTNAAYRVPVSGVVNSIAQLVGSSDDQVECSTCHDIHDQTNNENYALRVSEANTENLCKACHLK